jgi:succinoglycan biosynthesis protein ExoU
MSVLRGSRTDVAIIIAAWNAEATLGRAIESALSQENVSIEIVVVDDASTDQTLSCARSFAQADPRITVLRQSKNAGPAAARNLALEVVRARYVTPLDSDDFMDKGRLAHLLEIASEDDWDFVGDDLFQVDEAWVDGPRRRLWSQTNIGTVPITFAEFIRGNLSSVHGGRGELGFLKPLISVDFLKNAELKYQGNMRLGEDYALYATALLKDARFCLTDPAGYIAVTRAKSLSGYHGARELGALVQADLMLMDAADLSGEEAGALRLHYIETLKKWHWTRLIDAVKARRVLGALGCFVAPPAVVLFLLGCLREQLVLRSGYTKGFRRGEDGRGKPS